MLQPSHVASQASALVDTDVEIVRLHAVCERILSVSAETIRAYWPKLLMFTWWRTFFNNGKLPTAFMEPSDFLKYIDYQDTGYGMLEGTEVHQMEAHKFKANVDAIGWLQRHAWYMREGADLQMPNELDISKSFEVRSSLKLRCVMQSIKDVTVVFANQEEMFFSVDLVWHNAR